jgi:hypothetical protein
MTEENMTLAELQAETLVQKHLRLRKQSCKHEEIYSSTVWGPDGAHETRACLDCGKTWNRSNP